MTGQRGLDDAARTSVLDTLRAFADRRLDRETRLRLDAGEEDLGPLLAEMLGPELALHLVFLPADVGGLGAGALDVFRFSEELARVDLALATSFSAIALGIDPIDVGGTDAQRAHWLGRIAREGLIVGYGVTEPTAGSNVSALRTTATPIPGDDGRPRAYRLDGTKQFITNGGVAQLYSVLARTPGGPAFFVVERDTPGVSVGPPEDKLGIRASNTAQVILDGVEVPADQLLGEVEGRGLEQANEVFGYTRVMVAAFGIGAGEEALARAVAYACQREQFGAPLCRKQGFTHKLLVPHAVRLEAARAYCEQVAARLDAGERGLLVEGAIAKYVATEVGLAAADAAVQAHGGYGYTREYEVERILRDVRVTTIYEGTSEIQQSIIGMRRRRAVVRSRGGLYRELAAGLRALGAGGEAVGAPWAAAAADALAETVLAAHRRRLPRQQHVLFELARLIGEVETAAALCHKAAGLRDADPARALLGPAARLHAGEAARALAVGALELLVGSGALDADAQVAFRASIDVDALLGTVDHRLADQDRVAAAITTLHP